MRLHNIIAVVCSFAAIQTSIAQALPDDAENYTRNGLPQPEEVQGLDMVVEGEEASMLQDRGYTDANSAVASWVGSHLTIPLMCVGTVVAGRAIVLRYSTPAQRRRAYDCLAGFFQRNRVPGLENTTGSELEGAAHVVGAGVDTLGDAAGVVKKRTATPFVA